MAQLTQFNLTLEITFGVSGRGYINYYVRFSCQGKPVINTAILEGNEGRARRSSHYETFGGDDYRWDRLIPTLEKILETNEPDYWEPVDPDLTIAVYPDMGFPMLPSHYEVVYESDASKEESAVRAAAKAKKGKLPDDYMTIVVMANQQHFLGSGGSYGAGGIALVLSVYRHEMEAFVEQLKADFAVADAEYHFADIWKSDDESDDQGEDGVGEVDPAT